MSLRRTLTSVYPVPVDKLDELTEKLKKINVSVEGWEDSAPTHCALQADQFPGAWFDVDEVIRVIRVIKTFRHTKGEWAGRSIVPAPWQIMWVIAPVFGWKKPDGYRVINNAWIEIPRKNGKSTISSALANVLFTADREAGAEVYAAAGTLDQANLVFSDSKKMMQTCGPLKNKVSIFKKEMRHKKTGSFFKVLSKAADAAHGLNVHAAVVDEIHVHKTRDLIDAIESGTGARRQPLVIFITTADEGEEFSIYGEKHDDIINLASNVSHEPTTYGVIWCAEEKDDPFDPATWKKANPGLGVSPKLEYLEREAKKAANNPLRLSMFLRLHLNIRTKATAQGIDIRVWDRNKKELSLEENWNLFTKGEVYAGLDLSSVNDFSCVSYVKAGSEYEGEIDNFCRFWLPEDRLDELDKLLKLKGQLHRWVDLGYLTLCEGPTIDYTQIEETIKKDFDAFNVKRLTYDAMFAGQMTQNLAKHKNNVEIIPIKQGYAALSPPWKELKKLVLENNFNHYQNPILRWHAQCVEETDDSYDNQKPHRPERARSSKRIDGIAATVDALDGYIRREIKDTRVTVYDGWTG